MKKNRRLPAAGLLLIAAGAAAGTVVAPGSADVLIAIAGTGVYSAVLLVTLTRGRHVPASVSRSIYEALSENEATITSESGFGGGFRYVPADPSSGEVRLAALRTEGQETPSVMTGSDKASGSPTALLLKPTGSELFAEFETMYTGSPSDPNEVLEALVEAARDEFELADSITVKKGPEDALATLRVAGSVVGNMAHVDHPLQSFVSVGLVKTVNKPVRVESHPVPETEEVELVFRVDTERGISSSDRRTVAHDSEVGGIE